MIISIAVYGLRRGCAASRPTSLDLTSFNPKAVGTDKNEVTDLLQFIRGVGWDI